ncbi:MAG: hypothetical protein KIT09_30230 [Bryobacteraceae bacterium]|nr:hypothetical protein [Bryobacteraceae bacterium]
MLLDKTRQFGTQRLHPLRSEAADASCVCFAYLVSIGYWGATEQKTLREDDLIVEPIEIRNSYALAPDRPGLGVELDEDAVRKYRFQS